MIIRIIVMFAITLMSLADDFKNFKISNKITLISFLAGVCLIFIDLGNLADYLLGGIATFGVMFIFYMSGAIGGGDVKLLSTIGFIIGFLNIRTIVIWAFIGGAFIGILGILSGKLRKQEKGHIMHFSLATLVGEVIWFGGWI